MTIGILITSISNFGEKGFYNAQEIGMAKAVSCLCEKVIVYKLVPASQKKTVETLEGYDNMSIRFIPAENMGINGMIDVSVLDAEMDALLHFADTQFSVPKVYQWTLKNKVQYIPYIGVVESHSTSRLKQFITNAKFSQNLKVYKKCRCLAKTPEVQGKLKQLGVKNVSVAPVGLDMALLKTDYTEFSVNELKAKYGYSPEQKVLLFIGRLIDEKRPLKMVEIFKKIVEKDNRYELLLVGSGELKEKVLEAIRTSGIEEKVQFLEKIPNTQIWELYRIADAFVNLNRQEIFGMAILEAMYYGCKVVAWHAPGPDFIIEDGVSGCLVNDDRELINKVFDEQDFSQSAHRRICDKFTWESTARTIAGTVEK